ncbi:hypothetical protein Taro_035529 [Colocasia esculenta]|uniref:Uncharacterized protein n=1 Tax=Colocasia esculenta TaxID=4460 RepID=A0A843W6Y0_COLES|nr:hypothetical protein [Colocasia esculenta]
MMLRIDIGDPCFASPIQLLHRDPREGSMLLCRDPRQVPPRPLLQLLLGGYRAVVVDNLENSSEIAIRRVVELAGDFGKNLVFQKKLWQPQLQALHRSGICCWLVAYSVVLYF